MNKNKVMAGIGIIGITVAALISMSLLFTPVPLAVSDTESGGTPQFTPVPSTVSDTESSNSVRFSLVPLVSAARATSSGSGSGSDIIASPPTPDTAKKGNTVSFGLVPSPPTATGSVSGDIVQFTLAPSTT